MSEQPHVKRPDDFTAIPDWLLYREDFTALEKVCYARMRRYCLKKGHGWASQDTLAKQIGCSDRKVRDCVRKFVDRGLVKLVYRGDTTYKFYVLIPPQFIADWKRFEKQQAEVAEPPEQSELNWSDVGAVENFDHDAENFDRPQENFDRPQENFSTERSKTAYKETSEETNERNKKRENSFAGSLRSPEKVSLRSTFQDGGSVTKECFPAEEGLSQALGNAADPVALPQPPVPEIVSQPSPGFVVGVPLMEDEMSDEERKRRMESARMQAQMAEHKHDVVRVAKEAKQKQKAKRAVAPGELPKLATPKPKFVGVLLGLQDLWLGEYRRKFPNDAVASSWTIKQGSQIKPLTQLYALEDVERAIRYFLRHWEVHQPRFFKGKAQVPTLGMFCSLHETLLPESKRMFFALKAKADYEEWAKQHPDEVMPPEELQKTYNAALPALKSLGL